ncbi:DUF5320 domain-containing protein [Candidatus Parcubacteria bacterium]|nr:DUF5320 domain-containing protein [Patescibacteria group bacterium]MBU4380667.1 DUF5320 domain-containing protein [Patescibacteria group bacterium]MCG2689584.1 DUF5320 domain-containing protein [Candidatus Parcubacteria bacterium]
MPALDKTGPQGQGPMTGMRFGRCRGYGRGLGRYFGWNVPQTKEEKVEDIKAYRKALQEEIEETEKELANLQKQD